ncbi:hypothetical protein E4U14_000884, partial [Claviceps sp. LM454 group G7]
MAISTMLMIAISAAVLSTVQGQQFDGYTFPHDLLGLSDGCFATVNKTISSCPAWLPRYAGLEYVNVRSSSKILHLDPNIVILTKMHPTGEQLLRFSRASSSRSCARALVEMTCKASELPFRKHAPLLPTLWCPTNLPTQTECFDSASASGKYCDAVVADWANQPNYTSAQTCSQCELGVQQLQLASPFGFSDTLAQAFANTTQSCSAADYKFATPTSYALNATQFPSQPPVCTGTAYTITQDDS